MSEEQEKKDPCENCGKLFLESKLPLHEAYCLRNCIKCKFCSEFLDKSEVDQHVLEEHAKVQCKYCYKDFTKQELPNHEEKLCFKRPIKCKYCELKLSKDQLDQHEYECGSRTKFCALCEKNIILRTYDFHVESCTGPEQIKQEQPKSIVQPKYQQQYPQQQQQQQPQIQNQPDFSSKAYKPYSQGISQQQQVPIKPSTPLQQQQLNKDIQQKSFQDNQKPVQSTQSNTSKSTKPQQEAIKKPVSQINSNALNQKSSALNQKPVVGGNNSVGTKQVYSSNLPQQSQQKQKEQDYLQTMKPGTGGLKGIEAQQKNQKPEIQNKKSYKYENENFYKQQDNRIFDSVDYYAQQHGDEYLNQDIYQQQEYQPENQHAMDAMSQSFMIENDQEIQKQLFEQFEKNKKSNLNKGNVNSINKTNVQAPSTVNKNIQSKQPNYKNNDIYSNPISTASQQNKYAPKPNENKYPIQNQDQNLLENLGLGLSEEEQLYQIQLMESFQAKNKKK